MNVHHENSRRVVIDSKYKYVAPKAKQPDCTTTLKCDLAKISVTSTTKGRRASLIGSDLPEAELDNSNCYTPKERLNSEELAAFEAKEFTVGFIPLMPPPKCLA